MYIGLGFGTSMMSNADMVFCYYNFTNKASDKFECYDQKTDANRVPSPDSTQDLYNVSTVVGVGARTTSSPTSANFGVKFTRPMRTNDTAGDYQLNSRVEDIIWSIGSAVANTPQQHTAGNYGSSKLNLTMAPYYEETSSSAIKTTIASFFGYVAILTLFVLNF